MLKLLYRMQKYDTRTISIAGKRYSAIVADTSTKRAIGLMFRESLPEGSCMLFLFGGPGYHSIWMRNMKFPIDVAWLDKDGLVLDTKTNIKPCQSLFDCPQYSPKVQAHYLIELNAGELMKNKIKEGSTAKI